MTNHPLFVDSSSGHFYSRPVLVGRNGRVAIAIGIVAGVLAVAVVAGVVLERTHQAPPALALSTPTPAGSASALSGKWQVAPGSQAGYRVKEQFINQPAPTEAVARTSRVSGSLVASVSGTILTVTAMKFSVDLASLVSQDRYAQYQVYQRDFFIRTIYLQTDSFPTATFGADSATLTVPETGPVAADVTGKLTVHGLTRSVVAHVRAQSTAGHAEVAGNMQVDMRDFAIEPPDISFTKAESQVTIEFDLVMVRA